MSSAAVARVRKSLVEAPWQLWASQFAAVLRIEIKKTLWMRRSIWIYLLAFAPTADVWHPRPYQPHGPRIAALAEDTRIFAYIFQIFYLRVGIFFGCMGLFTWLFRGEIVEKSLHYYFLSPVRRELLVAGKFVARLDYNVRWCLALRYLLCFTFAYGHFGAPGRAFVFNGPGLGHLTVLSAGYGACLRWALVRSFWR